MLEYMTPELKIHSGRLLLILSIFLKMIVPPPLSLREYRQLSRKTNLPLLCKVSKAI